jgi:CoA:oxalate CoA-transferase
MTNGKGAMSGITVLDLTQFLSGPFCTMILADLGAEVIKIERPDRPKASGPFLGGERTYDLSINRGKKGITLNLKNPMDKDIFLQLAKRADVVVENFKPGTMEKMGLGYEEIKKIKPDIIFAAISGFGETGPYRQRGALDMVIQGMSGLMSITGEPGGRPVKAGSSVSDLFTGIYAYGAIASALYYRSRTGTGQFIDIAMLDSMFSCLENAVINYFVTGENPGRVGNRHATNAPFQSFKTSDGEIIITASRDSSYNKLCTALGREDLITDPRFSNTELRRINADELEEEITKFTILHTMTEMEEILNKVNVPNGRINTLDMICNSPQIIARNMVVEADHPVAGKYKMAGSPLKFSETPPVDNRPAPLLGQHNYEVFSGMLRMSDEQIKAVLAEQAKLAVAEDSGE